MAKTKTFYDIEEIDEIIELYIKHYGGVISELKFKTISDFNSKIANNQNYQRKNGNLYKLYKYNFWGGSYKGEYNYGKKRIIEINKKNKVRTVGNEFQSDISDIVAMINSLHKNPQKLIQMMSRLFDKERKKILKLEADYKKLKEDNYNLLNKIENLETGITNLIFYSQNPNNSLNNMLNISKSEDSICYDELVNMFNDINRFERINFKNESCSENVISIDEANRLKRLKELEEDGF